MQNHLISKTKAMRWVLFSLLLSGILRLFCMHHANLLVEETYYWNYAQHLDWGYLDHPPMVALLIKAFTSLFGLHEFSVRIASIFCWCVTAFYCYRLSEVFARGSGLFALLLLAVLPYFFTQSIVITPDSPLIACWAAVLYYLYQSLVLGKSQAWYKAGIWIGLGMLSKYTLGLLGFAALAYMIIIPNARQWFLRKEPYLAAFIALLIFSPVIYWNAQNEWASFLFQSQRRFAEVTAFKLPNVLLFTLLFLTPAGCLSFILLSKKTPNPALTGKSFLQIFTFIPWCFFALHSVNHQINLNWLGPIFLSLIPWVSYLMIQGRLFRKAWYFTTISLLSLYGLIIIIICINTLETVQQKMLIKVIAWDKLVKELNQVAQQVEAEQHSKPLFVPLDNYPINSELAFYQKKLLAKHQITTVYQSSAAHLFNRESLMYRYWTKNESIGTRPLILISKELWRFDDPEVTSKTKAISPLSFVWSEGQGMGVKNIPYYYKVVTL